MLVSNPVRSLLAALLLLGVATTGALSSPTQVIRDYRADARLDRPYSARDLLEAGKRVEGTPLAAGLNQAIYDRLAVDVAGFQPKARSARPAPGAKVSRVKVANERTAPVDRNANELPGSLSGISSAPAGRPAGGLPVAVTVLGALAAALALSGLASGIARRRTNRV